MFEVLSLCSLLHLELTREGYDLFYGFLCSHLFQNGASQSEKEMILKSRLHCVLVQDDHNRQPHSLCLVLQ